MPLNGSIPYSRISGVVRQSALRDGFGHAFDRCCRILSALGHDTAPADMQSLLASPRLRFVGGTRVMAATASVKTANTVALAA